MKLIVFSSAELSTVTKISTEEIFYFETQNPYFKGQVGLVPHGQPVLMHKIPHRHGVPNPLPKKHEKTHFTPIYKL